MSADPRLMVTVDESRPVRVVRPCADMDGPVTAALLFRVGITDESLVQRGITHLLEHLVLSVDRATKLEWNGMVDLTRTVFYARGARDEVSRWLGAVSGRLADPPLDRLEHERGILEAESLRSSSGPFEAAMRLRYGLAGPGVLEVRELGLRYLGADDLLAWRDTYFTAGNCIVWTTADLPDLDLELASGRARLPQLPDEVVRKTPAVVDAGYPTLVLTGPVTRSPAMNAAMRHLQRRSQEALRHEQGIAYHVGAGYLPFSGELAFATLSTEAVEQRLTDAQAALLGSVADVMQHGVTPQELADDHAEMTRISADPMSLSPKLDSAASSLLLGEPHIPEEVWMEKLAALHPDDVADAVTAWADTTTLLTPAPHPPPGGFVPFSLPQPKTLPGDTIRPKFAPLWDGSIRLHLSDRGVMYVEGEGVPSVVRFDRCAGVLAWEDGSRTLYHRDGTWLHLDVVDWHQAHRITAHVDQHAPRPFVPMGKEPERAPDWKQQRRRALLRQYRFVLLLAALAAGILLLVYVTSGDDKTPFFLTLFAIVVTVVFWPLGDWLGGLLGRDRAARQWERGLEDIDV